MFNHIMSKLIHNSYILTLSLSLLIKPILASDNELLVQKLSRFTNAMRGDTQAQYEEGEQNYYLWQQDNKEETYAEALDWLSKAADKGHGQAKELKDMLITNKHNDSIISNYKISSTKQESDFEDVEKEHNSISFNNNSQELFYKDIDQTFAQEIFQLSINYIHSLPQEILIKICKVLNKKDLLRVRFLDKWMKEAADAVYRKRYVTNYGMAQLPQSTTSIQELNLSVSDGKIRRLGYASCTPISADAFKNYYRYFELPDLVIFNVAYGQFSSRWRPNDLDLILKWRPEWPPAGVYFLGETLENSTKLEELILSHCDLLANDFEYLTLSILPLFKELKILDLEGNIINEESAPYVGYSFNYLTQLRSLSLTVDCKAYIDHLSTLGAMPSLEMLKVDLSEGDNGPLYEFISDLTRLTSLHLSIDKEQPLGFATGYVSLCNMLLTLTQLNFIFLRA